MYNMNSTIELRTKNLTSIGLDIRKSKELAEKLNELLANYSIFHQNVRGYHWNIKGENFFQLHLKFEDLYASLYSYIDEISERILTLGYPAEHNFSDYIMTSKIGEATNVSDDKKAVRDILDSLNIIISIQREIVIYADEVGDDGTHSLMSDYIRSQEKMIWMYDAFLEK